MRVCAIVETVEIYTYIYTGRKLSYKLLPHKPLNQQVAAI